MLNTDHNKNKVLKKLGDFLKKKNLRDIAIGFLKSLIVIILTFLFFSFLESFSYFSTFVKTIIFVLMILLASSMLVSFVLKPLLNYLKQPSNKTLHNAAAEIGNHFPSVKDNLLNSLQLLQTEDKNTSYELAEAAFLKVYKSISDLNFNQIIKYNYFKKVLKIFGAVVFISTLIFISFNTINNAAFRLLNFNKEYAKPVDFTLEIITGNAKIKKGNNLQIKVSVKGKAPKEIIISTKNKTETEFNKHIARLDSSNIYLLNLRNIKSSFTYFAQKGDIKTESYKVEVISPPIINNFSLDLIPPRYSRLPKWEQQSNGNISALKGTKINVKLSGSKILSEAQIIFSDSSKKQLEINNNQASGSFIVKRNIKYHFSIIDTDNNFNENPIKYNISLIEDNYPDIEITSPEQNSLLPNNDIISINYTVKDDYGFSKLSLYYNIYEINSEHEEQKFSQIDLDINNTLLEQTSYYNWDVSRLNLKENEIVLFYLEVFDNDFVSGPKSTKSKLFKFRVPTLDEFFAQSDIIQDNAVKELTKTIEETEELKKELNQINNELKQNEQKIDWNEKEKIEEAVKKFDEIKNKIEEVQKNLAKMQKQMMENNLLSEETMKKYNELQKLMDELSSEEMRKAMEQMQKSLEKLMRDNVQKSLENFTMNEKMFQKSIERTLNLLKKIQIEQKMDEVIKRSEKLVEDLEKLSEETKKTQNKQTETDKNELTKEQQNIDDQLKKLEEEMKKLAEKMSEVEDTPKEQMDKINDDFEKQKNNELSEEALEQLQEQNFEQSLKNQQQLAKNMTSMKNELQQLQKQMQQQSQQMVMQNMLKAIDNIIDLSKEQEQLKNTTDNLLPNPNNLPQEAENQMELRQNLDKVLQQLGELSQKTFAISPEMGKALGNARKNMDNALNGLQSKNGQRSTFNQSEAMKNLNEAASLMQKSLQAMMQGGGQGGGMMSLMQQLQKMAQQQMGLNNLTKMLQQGQLTMQQQAQLQRLAQEQGMIQKSLAELNKEARASGESKKLASNLEKIVEDMQEVISGFNSQKIDDDLIKKQDKILSKLLDAQRSINERDFEEKREARAGKNFNLTSPGNLNLTDEKSKDILREELLKAVEEGYTKDYKELIRRYFESLDESTN